MTDLPMTVIGGYLGAGKTTLLNKIMARAGGQRIAVVVNDFGSVNVDADLLRSKEQDTIELSNGCICCSLTDGMAQVMDRLREMRDRLDHVVVEVSGVGDPGAVAAWGDHPGFRRNGVVVCVDVLQIRELAADRWVADTVLAQLRSADTVLLTKTDLAGPEGTARVHTWVDDLAAHAEVLGGNIVPTTLLDSGRPSRKDIGPTARPTHTDSHASWSLSGRDLVPFAALSQLLRQLPPSVVRAKGVLRTDAAPDRRTVVQLAGGRVEVRDDGPWVDRESLSTLVLIVRGSDGPHRAEPSYVAEVRNRLRLVDAPGGPCAAATLPRVWSTSAAPAKVVVQLRSK